MFSIKKMVLPIIIATIWISISEFARNTFLLQKYWIGHFKALGLTFPEKPINGALWGLWSLSFAIAIYILSKKYTLTQTTILTWFLGFVFMWIVIGNLGVLPLEILPIAIPLSMIEAYIATWLIFKFSKRIS